jgi:hypothetical protein
MAGYIQGFEGRPPICPPEMSDLPGFISGHTEGKAARKQVSNAAAMRREASPSAEP